MKLKQSLCILFLGLLFCKVISINIENNHFLAESNDKSAKDKLLFQQSNLGRQFNERLKNAFNSFNKDVDGHTTQFIIGIVLLYSTTTVLWISERKAYNTAKKLRNSINACHEIRVIDDDHNLNSELILAKGIIRTLEPIQDKIFGITVKNCAKLIRNIEIFQVSDSIIQKDRSEQKNTTKWVPYQKNKTKLKFVESEAFYGQKVRLGAFYISQTQLEQLNYQEPYILTVYVQEMLKIVVRQLLHDFQFPYNPYVTFTDKYMYIQQNNDDKAPIIDDIRISFDYVSCDRVTVVCSVNNNKFESYDLFTKKFKGYETQNGKKKQISGDSAFVDNVDKIFDFFSCLCHNEKIIEEKIDWVFKGQMLKKEEVFQTKYGESSKRTNLKWAIRLASYLMVIVGTYIMFSPIVEVFSISQYFLDREVATLFVSCLVGICNASMIIALAWFFYRPVLNSLILILSLSAYALIVAG